VRERIDRMVNSRQRVLPRFFLKAGGGVGVKRKQLNQ